MSATSEMAGLGRRERKKLQTRRALEQAALTLVRERGFDGVTVEQIADAVDVSTRTFFNYFASKEEAVIGQDPGVVARLTRALAARPVEESSLESLRVVLTELAAELPQRRDEWVAQRALIRSEPRLLSAYTASWLDFERALIAGVAERTGHDPERDVYPALVVGCAVSATRVALLRWHTDDQIGLSELVSAVFAALATGLDPGGAGPIPLQTRAEV